MSFADYRVDYHVHTNYTGDATGTIEDYCEMAEKSGIKEIASTNHLNFSKFKILPELEASKAPIVSIRVEEVRKIYEEIEKAREQFGIKIKFGMEIDYFEVHESKIKKLINDYPFDFILGSVHFIDGFCLSESGSANKLFQRGNVLQIYIQYFSKLKKAIESQLFDVIAHPDIVRRFAVQYADVPFEKYRKHVEAVVNSLVESGVGIEMNTYGYVHPVRDSYPSLEFLKICKDFGVKIITIGSDAHSPSKLGSGLEKGIEKLKKAGYEKICLFTQRKQKELLIAQND